MRWMLVLTCIALGVVGGGLTSLYWPKQYESDGAVYVVPTNRPVSSSDLYHGTILAQYRMPTYLQLVTSATVLDPVIEQLGLSTTARQLAERVTVTRADESASLLITATARRPAQAQQIVDAIMAQLIETVARLEQVSQGGEPPVVVRVQSSATAPEHSVLPDRWLNLGIGAGVGGVIGAGVLVMTTWSLMLTRRSRSAMWIYLSDSDWPSLVLVRVVAPEEDARGLGAHTTTESADADDRSAAPLVEPLLNAGPAVIRSAEPQINGHVHGSRPL